MNDLLILVADLDMEQALHGILARWQSLQIRPIHYTIQKHPNRDAGCRTTAHAFLRPFRHAFRYSLVIFDYEGSGHEHKKVSQIRAEVQELLDKNGWENRNEVVIIQPELEAWIWSDSPHVETCLRWGHSQMPLKNWLIQQGLWEKDAAKPHAPKEALLTTLAQKQRKPSPAIYHQLASQVSFKRCTDESFQKLVTTLQTWFSET